MCLVNKRGLDIRSGGELHFSKSSAGRKKGTYCKHHSKYGRDRYKTRIEDTTGNQSPEPMEGRYEPPVHKTYTKPHTFKDIFLEVVEQGQDSTWMYFMKFLSPSDLLIILTSNKGLFSSKVSYQLVMDLSRRAFQKCAYMVIERMTMEVENETLQPSNIRLLQSMAQEGCELFLKRNHRVLNYYSSNFGCAFCSDCLGENLEEVETSKINNRR
jgi:hypothetical protein